MSKNFTVVLKKIIAVNSAKFAYAEIPLDQNLYIVGSGNIGKTSIVNAIRFFLLPEVNLKNSDTKFAFVANSQDKPFYTKDEILDHYFPTDDSRLILEVEHLLLGGGKQVHCQIISRGSDYGLKRCFIPEPYSEIEHLFWDKNSKEAGSRPEYIPGQKIYAELNKINPKTKVYNQYEQLTQALYIADILNPEKSPFVIFPLKDTKQNSVDSLRALVKMLFNQDERSLRLMTATAIELRDQNDNVLALDVDAIISEQYELRKRKEQLDLLRSNESTFLMMKESFERILKEQSIETQFAEIYKNIRALKDRCNGKILIIIEDIKSKSRQINDARQACTEMEKQKYNFEQTIIKNKGTIEKNSASISKADEIIDRYFGKNRDEIIEILNEEIVEIDGKLEAFNSSEKKKHRLSLYMEDLKAKESELKLLEERKQHTKFSLVNQLDKNATLVLASINKLLADANPKRELTSEELSAIEAFTNLFHINNGVLTFYDSSLPYFSVFNSADLDNRIEEARDEIKRLNTNISDLSDVDVSDQLSSLKRVENFNKERKMIVEDLKYLESYDYHKKNNDVLKNEIEGLQVQLESLLKKYRELKEFQQELSDELQVLESQRNSIQTTQQQLEKIDIRFNLSSRFENIQAKIEAAIVHQDFEYTDDCEPKLIYLSRELEKIKLKKDEMRLCLNKMILDGLIDDEFGLLTNPNSDAILLNVFLSLEKKYALLKENSDVLDKEVKRHNQSVRNRLERLDRTRDRVHIFLKQINEELSHAKINDLECVRLKVTLHPFFEDLVNSWREYDDLASDGPLPEEWYIRLRHFLASDAVNQTDKILRMENVIRSVGYETKIEGQGWESKAQSNSTEMLINTHFCEMFIQKLSDDENAKVQFPVILDEIGSVSPEQFPDLIRDLNARGRKLIGVTVPGKSGEVTVVFENKLMMDELSTSQPYNKERRKVCYSVNVETIIKKISAQQSLFVEA